MRALDDVADEGEEGEGGKNMGNFNRSDSITIPRHHKKKNRVQGMGGMDFG